MSELLPVLVTALAAGLLGSGHCLGMCGGIAGSLGAVAAGRSSTPSALLFNLGRILSYAMVGAMAALVLGGAGEALNVPQWGRWLRILTAVLILMIGIRYLFNLNMLAPLERAGGSLWKRISPLAVKASARPGWTGRLLLGVCWGFLPCGLVYTIALTAAASGSAQNGAMVMLAFGVGTLPSMMGMTLAAPTLMAFLGDRWTRRLVGLALVLLAVWALILALPGDTGGQHHH